MTPTPIVSDTTAKGNGAQRRGNKKLSGGIYRIDAVCEFAGLSKASIYRLMKENKFPKPFKLTGSRAVGWREDSLLDWEEGLTQ